MKIEDFEFTVRSYNALKTAGIDSAEQLMKLTYSELTHIPNLGVKSVNEVLWGMVQLGTGEMIRRRKEWDKNYPQDSYSFVAEWRDKARKYDKLAKVFLSQEKQD